MKKLKAENQKLKDQLESEIQNGSEAKHTSVMEELKNKSIQIDTLLTESMFNS